MISPPCLRQAGPRSTTAIPLAFSTGSRGMSRIFRPRPAQQTPILPPITTVPADNGTISNWLISPELDFAATDQITFWTRTVDTPAFPDRLQVRLSTGGASTNVGAAATDVGDFTTLLVDINPTYTVVDYPVIWTQYTISSADLPASGTGRIAFRYFVEDAGASGTNSDYIGIDTVDGPVQELHPDLHRRRQRQYQRHIAADGGSRRGRNHGDGGGEHRLPLCQLE